MGKKTTKDELMWTIIDSDQEIVTIPSWKEFEAIKNFTSGFSWNMFKKDGYRVVRVRVTTKLKE